MNVSLELSFVVGIFPTGIRVRLGVNAGNAEGSVSHQAMDDGIYRINVFKYCYVIRHNYSP